ncbi:MAG: phosphotransferase [Nanoarchaeota archaeon]|nr:phosphotransferase [Nanoarchaeota archaeon]
MEKQKLNELISLWDIGEILTFKKATEGAVNYNYIIKTSKGKYILRKFCAEHGINNINFEMSYLNYLSEKKFPYEIPNPLLNKKNKRLIKIEKDFFCLYKYIEGNHLKESRPRELSEIALMIARMHNLLEKSNLNNGVKNQEDFGRKGIINEMKEFILKIPSRKNQRDKIFLKESKSLIEILGGLNSKNYNSLKKYPIHRDFNPQNILWKNNKIVGIIDFENVGRINDAFVRDIAIIFQYFCSNKEKNFNSKKAKFFLREYEKYRRLSNKEKEVIIDLMIATNIEDFGFAYWLLVNTPERAKLSHLNKYSKMSKYLSKNREKFIKELIN